MLSSILKLSLERAYVKLPAPIARRTKQQSEVLSSSESSTTVADGLLHIFSGGRKHYHHLVSQISSGKILETEN